MRISVPHPEGVQVVHERRYVGHVEHFVPVRRFRRGWSVRRCRRGRRWFRRYESVRGGDPKELEVRHPSYPTLKSLPTPCRRLEVLVVIQIFHWHLGVQLIGTLLAFIKYYLGYLVVTFKVFKLSFV